ncbi:MAG: MBL fold metallo-hydrolase [Pirellulales bacterium]|nr:MBL fold metallo-hydrolase [Pirellulales bacterium]
MSTAKPTIKVVLSMPFGENTYIAQIDDRSDCLIIDPGLEPDKIFAYLDRHSRHPAAILCTHGHSDHIAGCAHLKQRWPECPIIIGAKDASKLTDPETNLSAPFGIPLIAPRADRTVEEGDIISVAGIDLDVLDTPGHSAGHVVYIWRDRDPIRVFTGDVLFQGGVGRTDFPDGDFETLCRSIQEKLYHLPDDTIVLPGHGAPTTIGEEKRNNPFVRL